MPLNRWLNLLVKWDKNLKKTGFLVIFLDKKFVGFYEWNKISEEYLLNKIAREIISIFWAGRWIIMVIVKFELMIKLMLSEWILFLINLSVPHWYRY